MRSGRIAESCIPCVKRKVRCDKQKPCCHCKRRKQDTCEYPTQTFTYGSSSKEDQRRIEKLERYIRSLGGDPKQADQPGDDNSLANDHDTSNPQGSAPSMSTIGDFVSVNEKVTFINTPMWYSWSDTNTPQSSRVSSDAPVSATHQSCFPTLLQPVNITERTSVGVEDLPIHHLSVIWRSFLDNVHPLVKIFFDWEVEPLIRDAGKKFLSFSKGEQALIYAITFIATLALPEEACLSQLDETKSQLLFKYQRCVEHALVIADFTTTTNRSTFQAFMLYLIAMRDRAVPATIYSLMGIAGRIAERMGLHRDGDSLGLSVLRSEERRRMWWQLQFMEIAIARLVGSLSMTIFAAWDSKMPANLEDGDFYPDMPSLPSQRKALTSMSTCLWKYTALQMHRSAQRSMENGSAGATWLFSPKVPLVEKDARIDTIESELGTQFLQYCEPVNPLHLYLQIGIRSFILSSRNSARLPSLVNAKISTMSQQARNEHLSLCMKSLEYYIMSQRTESLKGFQWNNQGYFNCSSFVYLLLEANHRFDQDEVANLWSLIHDVYDVHPELRAAGHRSEWDLVAHIMIVAWQKHKIYVQECHVRRNEPIVREDPEWIMDLRCNFGIPDSDLSMPDSSMHMPELDPNWTLPDDLLFDFNTIDWFIINKL